MVVHKPGKPHKLPPTMALVFSPTPSSAGLEEFTSPRETSRSNSQQNLHAFVSSSHQNIHLQHGPLFSLSSPDDPLHDASPSNFQEAVEYDTDYTTEYNEILHSFYQPLLPDEDASASLYALPDHILQVILALVDVGDRLRSVPLVCTRFRDLLRRQHHSLWNKLQLPSCDAMSYRCGIVAFVHGDIFINRSYVWRPLMTLISSHLITSGAGRIIACCFVCLLHSGLCVMGQVSSGWT